MTALKSMRWGTLMGLATGLVMAQAGAQTATVTPTFNNLGVVVTLPAPTTQSVVRLFVKTAGAPTNDYREAHPLARLSSARFAGSVFGLKAGTGYDLRLASAAFGSDLLVAATTRSDSFPGATQTTYHVVPATGNDTNSGLSQAQALRTINRALTLATAGAKILLYDGTYYEGDLEAPQSGTPTAPIVIENAPGARPVLSGLATNFSAAWVFHSK